MTVFRLIYFSSTKLDLYSDYLDITAIFRDTTPKIGLFGGYLEFIQ